jgi:ATP-dependent Clp protease adaptor protein ClpS
MMISNSMDVEIDEKIKIKVTEPNMYKVVFLNDDATPMDFVIEILTGIFRHSTETARDITMEIHDQGSSVVGIYNFEIAEQKAVEATTLSRSHGFPLQIKVEQE